jgi:hypothetical protein
VFFGWVLGGERRWFVESLAGAGLPSYEPFILLRKEEPMCGRYHKNLVIGMSRFVVEFTWQPTEDQVAIQNLSRIINDPKKELPEGIDQDSFEGFYLTGQRIMIFFGQATSREPLEKLKSKVSKGNAIKVKISDALCAQEVKEKYITKR